MGVVEDIISVKSFLENEWDDIRANADNISKMILAGLTWVENNETTLSSDLQSAADEIEKGLSALEPDGINKMLEGITTDFSSPVKSLLQDLEQLATETDPLFLIRKLLDLLPDMFTHVFPNFNTDVVESIKTLLEKIVGDHFSFALKPLPPRNTPKQKGTGTTTAEKKELASLLFSAFEKGLEDVLSTQITPPSGVLNPPSPYTIEDELLWMKSKLEGLVDTGEKDLKNTLSGVMTALTNAEPGLTKPLIVAQLETLVDKEFDTLSGAARSFVTLVEGDEQRLKTVFKAFLNAAADDASDIANLYKELTGATAAPTLLEVVSLLIAIPLTLIEQATQTTFAFPNTPFQTLSKETQAQMIASIQLIGVLFSIVDLIYTTIQKDKKIPISWKYKVFYGLTGSLQTSLDQWAFYPAKNGFFSGPSKDNAPWAATWFTGFGYGAFKWILGAYIAKKNEYQTTLDQVKDRVTSLSNSYSSFETDLNAAYKEILTDNPKIKKVTTPNVESQGTTLSGLASAAGNVTSNNLQAFLDKIENSPFDLKGTETDLKKVSSSINKARHISTQNANTISAALKTVTKMAINWEETRGLALRELSDVSKGAQTADQGSTFLNEVCPFIDLGISFTTLGYKVYLHETDGSVTSDDLIKLGITTSFSSVTSGASIYYNYQASKNPDNKADMDDNKEKLTTGVFVVTQLYNIVMAADTLYKAQQDGGDS